jgi:hypothetical protein
VLSRTTWSSLFIETAPAPQHNILHSTFRFSPPENHLRRTQCFCLTATAQRHASTCTHTSSYCFEPASLARSRLPFGPKTTLTNTHLDRQIAKGHLLNRFDPGCSAFIDIESFQAHSSIQNTNTNITIIQQQQPIAAALQQTTIPTSTGGDSRKPSATYGLA